MDLEQFELLYVLAILSPILPLFVVFFYKKKLTDIHFNFIILFSFISLGTDILSISLYELFSLGNYFLIYLNTLFAGMLILYFYQKMITTLFSKRVFWGIFFVLILFLIIPLFIENIILKYQAAYIFVSLYAVIFSIVSMVKRVEFIQSKKEFFNIEFWINCGIFIYFGSTFFLTLFESTILLHYPSSFKTIWNVQWIATILFFSSLTIGIWKQRKI